MGWLVAWIGVSFVCLSMWIAMHLRVDDVPESKIED